MLLHVHVAQVGDGNYIGGDQCYYKNNNNNNILTDFNNKSVAAYS